MLPASSETRKFQPCTQTVSCGVRKAVTLQEVVVLSFAWRHSSWMLGKFVLRKSGRTLEQAAQESGGITVPGGDQENGRCCSELVGLDGLSHLFGPNDSMIFLF